MMSLEEETGLSQSDLEMQRIDTASQLLLVVWKSISPEYKSQYRAEIWRQFEERVATAARMTATLHAFLSRLCGMLQIASLGTDEQGRALVVEVLHGRYGDTDELLSAIRAYPQLCVVQVRVWNDQEKEMRNGIAV